MLFPAPADRAFASAVSRLVYCNPFLPERITAEREALGTEFVEGDLVWNALRRVGNRTSNVAQLGERATTIADGARQRIALGGTTGLGDEDVKLYEELCLYVLYDHCRDALSKLIESSLESGSATAASRRLAYFDAFAREHDRLLNVPGLNLPAPTEPAHLVALFFQIRRAFQFIYFGIVGRSLASARLRAAAWHSVFTHDMRRYMRALYDRMGDFTTLITGPSGTGKELVARAIGLSRYVPFDPKTKTFTDDFAGSFHPLNLSALSPTLIESELFGHRRGAFTGALEDRAGWLETCPPRGTVFLDEIGELDPLIQVKLLRVLQTRQFQRLGDTATRTFRGKIVAATNRDLAKEMAAGRFRADFYYRLCSDLIETPSLRTQLDGAPDDLLDLIGFITHRIAGEAEEAEELAKEVANYIGKHLGSDYPWPGNFRELEQCVRNVMIRKEYHPSRTEPTGEADSLAADLQAGAITADALIKRYCKLVYGRTKNYEETARRLGLDRRTVKAKVVGEDEDGG